jgi:hypothetical protein
VCFGACMSAPRQPSLHLNARQAANYLNIKSLLDLTCKTVADMIKGKTPEEIRAHFNIQNDFTPEEEEEVRWPHRAARALLLGLRTQIRYACPVRCGVRTHGARISKA